MSSILQRALGNNLNRHSGGQAVAVGGAGGASTEDTQHVPVELLEALRSRLAQLLQLLGKLLDQLSALEAAAAAADAGVSTGALLLPHYVLLQNQYNVIVNQLLSVLQLLEMHQEQLLTHNAFPLPAFPSTAEQNLLTTLLRKKHMPEVVDWVNELAAAGRESTAPLNDEFVTWCVQTMEQLQEQHDFHGFGKTEAVEPVVEAVPPGVDPLATPLEVEQILQFMHQGIDPREGRGRRRTSPPVATRENSAAPEGVRESSAIPEDDDEDDVEMEDVGETPGGGTPGVKQELGETPMP